MAFALEADLDVVGEAGDGQEALARAAELHPDVVLLDVAMPLMDGIAVAAALRTVAPESRVVILTLYDDPQTRARAIEAGAVELVGKHQDEGILTAIIRRAAAGASDCTADETLREGDCD